MYFTSAQRSASGITAPHGAISGEPPFDAAPLVMTSKMVLVGAAVLELGFLEVARGRLQRLADRSVAGPAGPWQVAQYIFEDLRARAASAAATLAAASSAARAAVAAANTRARATASERILLAW